MSDAGYTILAYAVGLGLMGGYAAVLWAMHRALIRRERDQPDRHPR
jgi:hypothetical protein